MPPFEGVPLTAMAQLLDRLANADDWVFLIGWLESVFTSRWRQEPIVAVRLLRAYREAGRFDRARDLSAALPPSPNTWAPLDTARLSLERAMLATAEGRLDRAEAELRGASRALSSVGRAGVNREQLDLHLASAQLELRMGRASQAAQSLKLAEHVAERLENGAWRPPVEMMLGHLAMRLADPRTAVKHYESALSGSPARGTVAMHAQGNLGIALAAVGRVDEARLHAQEAIVLAADLAPGWRHADMYDVLAIVEIASDRPAAALQAVDEALVVLGDSEQPMLRYQLADRRTWALAALGRPQPALQWLEKTERLRAELPSVDSLDDQELASTRARVLESNGQYKEAIETAASFTARHGDAYVTGNLNLTVGRCALALGDEATARSTVERVALIGDKHGWVFPERVASQQLWAMALKSGDSRVVRYAEKALGISAPPPSSAAFSLPSTRSFARISVPPPLDTEVFPASANDMPAFEGEALLYVTTPEGVARVPASELSKALAGATLVVDTLTHALRVEQREVSLERRRALEPLVVQLLRRAKEGLSAEEILRAAGGPGPESADAEHRVRVLISRVRDLLGDASTIERVRDAGEYGKTRYRLAQHMKFALVEPLSAAGQG
jgi:tetratricopeptide (TPR) repeat protein